MDYNISTWKTKRIDNLAIPMEALYHIDVDLIKRGYAPKAPVVMQQDRAVQVLVIYLGDGFINGVEHYDYMLYVTDIDLTGEASGTVYYEVLLPALHQSTGELEAVLIWEGGDYISRLIVKDGEVTESEVEL